jgi:hypothetical protein
MTGSVAYADFIDTVTGRFTFTTLPGDKTRVTGQFDTGITSPDISAYQFLLQDGDQRTVQDITQHIAAQAHINVPGTNAFQVQYPGTQLTGLTFVVTLKGSTIGQAAITTIN